MKYLKLVKILDIEGSVLYDPENESSNDYDYDPENESSNDYDYDPENESSNDYDYDYDPENESSNDYDPEMYNLYNENYLYSSKYSSMDTPVMSCPYFDKYIAPNITPETKSKCYTSCINSCSVNFDCNYACNNIPGVNSTTKSPTFLPVNSCNNQDFYTYVVPLLKSYNGANKKDICSNICPKYCSCASCPSICASL